LDSKSGFDEKARARVLEIEQNEGLSFNWLS